MKALLLMMKARIVGYLHSEALEKMLNVFNESKHTSAMKWRLFKEKEFVNIVLCCSTTTFATLMQ